jgi:Ran GTPase-activating protein (RanGAP) involved in mRNA processing and transport
MSGGRATGSKQHEDTTTDAALLALHLTHREATLLFAMAARHGATDSQIAHALRQGLPHLSDPDYFQDTSAGQQSEEEKDKDEGKHAAQQGKKKRRTVHAAQPQPRRLAADAFATALGAIPANDWWRTWAAGRTIMLRMTSKQVKNAVDKLRPPAIVRLSRVFLDNVVCCKRERLLHILTELEKMTSRCRITILHLEDCGMSGQDAGRLAGVLAQCPALSNLYLEKNQLGAEGAGVLAGVLPLCPALSQLQLNDNQIGDEGAGVLAGVLPQCPALCVLELGDNQIGAQGAGVLAGVLPQCSALWMLSQRSRCARRSAAAVPSAVYALP